MPELTAAERRALRAPAHALDPLVMIGAAGLTPAVLKEIDAGRKSHELIKVRMLGAEREARAEALGRICAELEAQPVQLIGRILVLYREAPEEEKKTPPPAAVKKPAARRR